MDLEDLDDVKDVEAVKDETFSFGSTFSDLSSEDSDYSDSYGKRKRSNFRLRSKSKPQRVISPPRPNQQQQSTTTILSIRSPKRCSELQIQPGRPPRIIFDLESSQVITNVTPPAPCVPQYDICKYYLKNNCHRSDCNFMHSDFPCKYYYLGLKCPAKNCLYLHGGVLSDFLKKVLVDHIQSASQSVLGKFNRYGRFKAGKLIDDFNQQLKNGVVNPVFTDEPAAKKTRWDVKTDNYLNLNKLERLLNSEQIQLLADKNIYSLDEIGKSLTIRQLKELNFTDTMIEELLLQIKNLKEVPVNNFKLQSNEKPLQIQSPMGNLFSFSNQRADDLPSFSVVPHYQLNLGQCIENGSPDYSEYSEGSERQLVIDEEFGKYDEPEDQDEPINQIREADSTTFVSHKNIESKIEIVDSENSAVKILLEPDDELFPFKPFMTDFVPASESFASINSCPLIEYKLNEVEIPKIRKKIQNYSVLDPRMNFYNINDEVVPSKLKLKIILQKSEWFRNLNLVEQNKVTDQINFLSIELENFDKKISLCKIFDIEIISNNEILKSILNNLHIYINVDGEIVEETI